MIKNITNAIMKRKAFIIFSITILCLFALISCDFDFSSVYNSIDSVISDSIDSKIKNSYVKNTSDDIYTDITLGEALASVLEDIKWKTVNGKGLNLDYGCNNAVEVTGKYEGASVLIRYQYYTETGTEFDGSYSFHSIYVDDTAYTDGIYMELITLAMANFGYEEGYFG